MYQSLNQVPDHLRLEVYEYQFEERDCWTEYLTAQSHAGTELPVKRQQYLGRAENRWKEFIQGRGKHHALCSPEDAESYAKHLLNHFPISVDTAARYWIEIERFYRWMFQHTEYPHRYHPFVMSAAANDVSRELWVNAIERGNHE